MSKTIQNLLIESGNKLKERTEILNDLTSKLWLLESQLDQVKGIVMNMEAVQHLGNQTLRDAKVINILDNHEEYSPMYRDTLQTRAEISIAKNNLRLAEELNKNIRALLMNGGLAE